MDKKPNKYYYDGSPEFKPLSPWAYFGYTILFGIPLIGFICNIIFCFSDKNINRRCYARSIWCGVALAFIVTAATLVFAFSTGLATTIIEEASPFIDKVMEMF